MFLFVFALNSNVSDRGRHRDGRRAGSILVGEHGFQHEELDDGRAEIDEATAI